MDTVITPLSLKKDLLTGTEFSPALLRDFFGLAAEMKAHPERYRTSLAGQVFVLIFEKPSLRTRVTFETGIANLGGSSIFLDHTGAKMSRTRADSRHREKSRALGAGHRGARLRAGIARRACGQRQHSRDQRALGQIPSLPGARRFLHAARTLRRPPRAEARLRGRRQQHVPFADEYRRAVRRARSRRNAQGLRAGCHDRRRIEARGSRNARQNRGDALARRSSCGRAGRLHRRLGQHGPGSGSRRTRKTLRSLPGERNAFRPGLA